MKTSSLFLFLSILFMLCACGNAHQINGKSIITAHKSVAMIKERLSTNQRVEFEVAYWVLRNQIKEDAEFLKTIDHKTSKDIVELGKASFIQKKATGVTEISGYEGWDQMLAKQIEQRAEQDRSAVDNKDKKGYPRVDYKMHAM